MQPGKIIGMTTGKKPSDENNVKMVQREQHITEKKVKKA